MKFCLSMPEIFLLRLTVRTVNSPMSNGNLGIITRLYEGKTEDFEALLADYRAKLADAPEVSDDEDIMPKSYWQSNIDWLTERFPEGKYRDVVGLCKVATIGKVLMTGENLLAMRMTVSVVGLLPESWSLCWCCNRG